VIFEEKDVDVELSNETTKDKLAMKSMLRKLHTMPVSIALLTKL
jgi:hypothetical protein